ncbi:MAG: hypothetical protein J6Z08_07210, partial [Elusimicrobiales bacterium]|nr:hypothetical protein [Elusimicrobiales bacterium]
GNNMSITGMPIQMQKQNLSPNGRQKPGKNMENDTDNKAVMQAYGIDIKTTSDPQCVAFLMKRYREMEEKLLC